MENFLFGQTGNRDNWPNVRFLLSKLKILFSLLKFGNIIIKFAINGRTAGLITLVLKLIKLAIDL